MMLDRGAQASDDQLLDIMDYLFRTQTMIDVNKGPAEDLEIILNISPEQAQAIVARREIRKIVSLDDLKSVGGLEGAAVEAKAGVLVFQ